MSPGARPPLHVADTGEGEPALVFLHQFAGSGRAWAEVIAAIGPGRRCLALDLRGFGQSQDGGPGSSISEHIDDLLAALQAARARRFVLVGHSMGGKIAWAAAVTRPPGLLGVVLAAPSPPTPEPMSDDDRRERLAAFGDRNSAEQLATRIGGGRLSEAALERFVADSMRTAKAAWDGWLLAGSLSDVSGPSWPVGLPALVVSGLGDTAISTETVRREVVARIDGAKLVTLPSVGHLLPYEVPSDLAGLIRTFASALVGKDATPHPE